MFLLVFNTPVSPMLMKKALKAFATSLGSEIVLPFVNLNSFGKSPFSFFTTSCHIKRALFKVSLIVTQVFCKLVEYLIAKVALICCCFFRKKE